MLIIQLAILFNIITTHLGLISIKTNWEWIIECLDTNKNKKRRNCKFKTDFAFFYCGT